MNMPLQVAHEVPDNATPLVPIVLLKTVAFMLLPLDAAIENAPEPLNAPEVKVLFCKVPTIEEPAAELRTVPLTLEIVELLTVKFSAAPPLAFPSKPLPNVLVNVQVVQLTVALVPALCSSTS